MCSIINSTHSTPDQTACMQILIRGPPIMAICHALHTPEVSMHDIMHAGFLRSAQKTSRSSSSIA